MWELTFSSCRKPFAAVSRLMKIASLLMVALWLPATLHCQLENLEFGGLFGCPTASQDTTHAGNEACANDACLSVESGQFIVAPSLIIPATQPALASAFIHFLLAVAPPRVAVADFISRQTVPLPLLRTWQFTRRAALPARAPDVLNT